MFSGFRDFCWWTWSFREDWRLAHCFPQDEFVSEMFERLYNLKVNYIFCFLKNMNSKEQTGHQISVLKQSFVSKNYTVRNFLTMTSVTWKGEISLDLAIGFVCQCSWPVSQHPFMGTLHWTVLLYRRVVWLTYSGKYINSIRETLCGPSASFEDIAHCWCLPAPLKDSHQLPVEKHSS